MSQTVINAALGFDTFLVQRHGIKKHLEQSTTQDTSVADMVAKVGSLAMSSRVKLLGSELGCYFCNDVVAPGNSTRDRTLDQQCTVTRPGVSMIAAAYAVELLVSNLQHPDGANAAAPSFKLLARPGDNDDDGHEDEEECNLGIIPHQIRGFLSRFTEVLPSTSAFTSCTACSTIVISKYQEEGFEFLMKAFNDSNYLEEITGLKKLHDETNLEDVWELSDNDMDSESGSIKSTSIA